MPTLHRKTCAVEGCERPVKANAMCDLHYKRSWLANRQAYRSCDVSGCAKPHMARGYCASHYYRWRRYGDPLVGAPSNQPAVDLPGETWRPVPDWPEYAVSNHGRVKRSVMDSKGQYAAGRLLKQRLSSDGYPRVRLYHDGAFRSLAVHQIVAWAFLPPPPPGCQVNHRNGVKVDNCPANLEWVTAQENVLHRYRVLGHRPVRGEKHGAAKLTRTAVLEMRARYAAGATVNDLASDYGTSAQNVRDIIARRRWAHT